MYAAMATGSRVSRLRRFASHQFRKRPMAWAYACRVLRLRMLAVKNSMNRRLACSSAATMIVGSRIAPVAKISRLSARTMFDSKFPTSRC